MNKSLIISIWFYYLLQSVSIKLNIYIFFHKFQLYKNKTNLYNKTNR